MWCAVLIVLLWDNRWCDGASHIGKYTFYRGIRSRFGNKNMRRLFSQKVVEVKDFPTVCALLDYNWSVICTGSVLTSRWVLTAGHCIIPSIVYIKYNTKEASQIKGMQATADVLYRHPSYKAETDMLKNGDSFVTTLHHDIGLVRTHEDIVLANMPKWPILLDSIIFHTHKSNYWNQQVNVYGFKKSKVHTNRKLLFKSQVKVTDCVETNFHECVCGLAMDTESLCLGDSGGPVVFMGVQIALTSLGPVECGQNSLIPPPGAMSVLTLLQPYLWLINKTISGTDEDTKMKKVSENPKTPVKTEYALRSKSSLHVLAHNFAGLHMLSMLQLLRGLFIS